MDIKNKVKTLIYSSICIVLCMLAGVASFKVLGLSEDNYVEQFFEVVITKISGAQIDLSEDQEENQGI